MVRSVVEAAAAARAAAEAAEEEAAIQAATAAALAKVAQQAMAPTVDDADLLAFLLERAGLSRSEAVAAYLEANEEEEKEPPTLSSFALEQSRSESESLERIEKGHNVLLSEVLRMADNEPAEDEAEDGGDALTKQLEDEQAALLKRVREMMAAGMD